MLTDTNSTEQESTIESKDDENRLSPQEKFCREIPNPSPLTSRNERMLFQVKQNKPSGGQEVWLDF